MNRMFTRVALSLLLVLLWGAGAGAAYQDDIGFTALNGALGGSIPTGAGVIVSQVEAGSVSGGVNYYLPFLPNPTADEFKNKTIIPTLPSSGVSGHATTVGTYFYGNLTSIAPGIKSIYGYDVDNWLLSGFLDTNGGQPLISSARVANHSWIGYFSLYKDGPVDPPPNADALKRLDWVINRDEYIQVVGMNNGSGPASIPLLGSAFNAIAVGLSSGSSQHGSYDLGIAPYNTVGRTRPDLVAPSDATSWGTPMVSAAAALLVEVGHKNPGLSTDPAVQSTTNRIGNTIYNAERSEVIKAALMAGASRSAIIGYTKNTDNGLNNVYGAGQLNIYNSYYLIAAGEQNSLQDASSTKGAIGRYGFDYDPYFGGLNSSNRAASYYFKALNAGEITASLVWNLAVGAQEEYDASATFYHLGLYLYDLSDLVNPVAFAASDLDNTENLWYSLFANHDYLLQVKALTGTNFLWDYGLAWDISTEVRPVPIPGTALLLGSGLLVLMGCRRKFRS
jgi:hypothetical protein